MNLELKFEEPHTLWNPLIVFKKYYEWLKEHNKEYSITFSKTLPQDRSNPSGVSSPHIMTLKNIENGKYIIVSYWDRTIELTWEGNGWNSNKMVELITSSGVHQKMEFTPFSYVTYSLEFEKISNDYRKSFEHKIDNQLLFRGFLYAERNEMKNYKPEYFSETRKSIREYFDEINNSKICLSLNGAGEICNRDMEILCCGSVLLRPELNQKFHNELIPNVHYVAVEKVNDAKLQLDLLIKKYQEIKYNYEFLTTIGNNGLEWFKQNASVESNVEILKKLINLEKLI